MPEPTVASTYPLLFAWFKEELRPHWEREKQLMIDADPQRHHSVSGEMAAAKLAALIADERAALEKDVRQRARDIGCNFDVRDEFMDFYDALEYSYKLKPYREVLQDMSGARSLMHYEILYCEQRKLEKGTEV